MKELKNMDDKLSLVSNGMIDSTTVQDYLIFINDDNNYNRSGQPINKDGYDYSFMTKTNIKQAFEDIKEIIVKKITNIIDKKTTEISFTSTQFNNGVFDILIEVTKKDNQNNKVKCTVELKNDGYKILVENIEPEKTPIIYFDRKEYFRLDEDINKSVSHIKDQHN